MDPDKSKEVVDESVVVAEAGSTANAAADTIKGEEDDELRVGDTLEFLAGPMTGFKGKIYYLDEDLVKLLPVGGIRKLDVIDLTQEDNVFTHPDTKVKITKTALENFVEIAELKVGNKVQTFNEGEPVYIYEVVSVNLETDTAELEELDEERQKTGNVLELQFTVDGRVRGIERDIGFDVMLTQDVPKPETNQAETNEAENEEEVTLREIVEEPEEEITVLRIYEKSAEEIIYEENVQKDDFVRMELAALDPKKRSNPKELLRIHRLMESCLQLKNAILEYTPSGKAELKEIVYITLAALLTHTDFPLAKQVLNVSKSVFLDHSERHFKNEEYKKEGGGKEEDVDPIAYDEDTIDLHYLADSIVDGIDFLKTEFTSEPKELGGVAMQLPRFYSIFNRFFHTYYRNFEPRKSSAKSTILYDRDFFRLNPLAILAEPVLKGLLNCGDDEIIVGSDDIQEIGLSYMRALQPRIGKYGDRKIRIQGPIEMGDEAEITHYILFPLLFLRDLGAIRSGKLSIDIGNGLGSPKTMEMILTEGEGIEEIPRAGSILLVDKQGTNVGNIELETWLEAQPLYGNGIGDLLPFLKSFGLSSAEFTPYQQQVLFKKIKLYQANVKKYIGEMRKRAFELRKNPVPVDNFSLLSEDSQASLFKILESQPLLNDLLQKFKYYSPSWAKNDIGAFAYLFKEFPDFVIAAIANLPNVAQAEKRASTDIILRRYFEILQARIKQSEEGQLPIKNDCDHVKNLEILRKIQDEDKYVRVMLQEFLPMFQGETVNHWIECKVCNKHLMCEHEYLMILEHTHPKQKDTIHKKILLNFSDGVFNGKFICGNCGQPIQDIEYDNHLEFDDEGRPMIGAAPITDDLDDKLGEELDALLEVKSKPLTKKAKDPSEDTAIRTALFEEMSQAIGVYLPDNLDRMLRILERLMGFVEKDIKKYNEDIRKKQEAFVKKGEKPPAFPSYEEYWNQRLIGNIAAVLFMEVQSAIPEVTPVGVAEKCEKPSFLGFPLQNNETELEGITYISCAVASLIRNEEPWRTTLWIKVPMKDKKRQTSVQRAIHSSILEALVDSEIQMMLEKKREFLASRGTDSLTGRHVDRIPSDFLPLPIDVRKELSANAEAPTIGDAATPIQRAYAWILEAHKLALKSGVYEPGNPLSEGTCCYGSLMIPMEFWRKAAGLPSLPPKLPPLGPRGTRLVLQTKIRKPERLLGDPDPSIMYRIFLRVCFYREGIDNPRVGLPHEPGYDNKCPYCQFEFPIDPRLPPPQLSYSKDKSLQKKYDEEYKSEVKAIETKEIDALTKQGAIEGKVVQKDTFETLLKTTNSHFIIPPLPTSEVATNTLDRLLGLDPEPFQGFREMITTLKTNLLPYQDGKAADDEIRIAYAEVSERARVFKEGLSALLARESGEKTKATLAAEIQLLSSAPPQTVGELLRTFILLPLQRYQSTTEFIPVGIDSKKRRAIYTALGPEDRKVINTFMGTHTSNADIVNIAELLPPNRREILDSKVKTLLEKLTVLIPVFIKVLRPSILLYGPIGMPYIQNAMLFGALYEFASPTDLGGNLAAKNILSACFVKAQAPQENVLKTPDEIRKFILDDAEAEKNVIIKKLDGMKPDEKRAELLMKKYGLGDWARGMRVKKYDVEQQEFEAEQRRKRQDNFFNEERKGPQEEVGYDAGADDGEGE